jgi:hypothetical protein
MLKHKLIPFVVLGVLSVVVFASRGYVKSGSSSKPIAPAQEKNISVPFKGLITQEGIPKEGKVNLVLKIYDQSNGGTKLYEGIHEVEVTQGQYFALIQVPSGTIGRSETIWLEAASVEEKDLPLEQRQQFILRPTVITNGIAGAALCSTCGGSFPVFRGSFSSTNNPTEYGSGCSGTPIVRTDGRPFLCSGN